MALIGLLAACSSTPSGDNNGLVRHVTVDGMEREYLVYVPDGVEGPVPVVFMIHGTSGDGEKFYNISGWREKADAEGIVAVFPSALTYCLREDENHDGDFDDAGETKSTTKWAAGKLGGATMPLCDETILAQLPADKRALVDHPLMDDVAFFDAMVREIGDLADPKRMYVTGFSNGAGMSGRLMIERTNTFAAFAMNSGTADVPGPALRAAPAVVAFGSKDDGFTAVNGVTELPLDATLFDLPLLADLETEMCTDLSLDASTRTSSFSSELKIERHHYTGTSNELVIAVIDEATHQYPNGTNHPVVMADLLWDFFSKYTL